MESVQLRIPHPILEAARAIASLRGRNQSQILRQAMAVGLVELADQRPTTPKEETKKNDRRTD